MQLLYYRLPLILLASSIRIFTATCTLGAGLDPFRLDTGAKLVEPWAGRIASRCRCTCKAVEADGAGWAEAEARLGVRFDIRSVAARTTVEPLE
jgi:hypothetical protein